MPDFCLQYDLRIPNGNVNGVRRQRVYEHIDEHIDELLLQRGYQTYQQSYWRWRLEGPSSGVAFHIFIHAFANAVDNDRFGAGALRSLHYEQQRFNLVQVR